MPISTVTTYHMTSVNGIELGNASNIGVISFYNGTTRNKATIQYEVINATTGDIVFYSTNPNSTTYENIRISGSNNGYSTYSPTLYVRGGCEATTGFNVSSSLKYKTNIYDLPDNYNLDMLMKYRPIMYNLKVDESESPKFFPGFIAEEIDDLGAKLFVAYKDEKPEALDYSRICVHLVKAMQEMKTDYDTKISKLERQYEEMKRMMETLINKI